MTLYDDETSWSQIERLLKKIVDESKQFNASFQENKLADFIKNSKKLNNLVKHLYFLLYESSIGKIKQVQIAQQLQLITRNLELKLKKEQLNIQNYESDVEKINHYIFSLINSSLLATI